MYQYTQVGKVYVNIIYIILETFVGDTVSLTRGGTCWNRNKYISEHAASWPTCGASTPYKAAAKWP